MDRIEDMRLARSVGSLDIGTHREIYRESLDTTPRCERKRGEQNRGIVAEILWKNGKKASENLTRERERERDYTQSCFTIYFIFMSNLNSAENAPITPTVPE